MDGVGHPSAQAVSISRLLSGPRLAPYLREAGGNTRDALRLYRWNIELSGAVYQALHLFEVVLRNAIDVQLNTWNPTQCIEDGGGRHSAEWALDPAPLLRRLVRSHDLEKAMDRAREAAGHARPRRGVTHDDVVAQLTFATWRFLLPGSDQGRTYLWEQSVHRAFPHLSRDRRELVSDVEHIYRLRNRVAHLEPLLRSGAVDARLRSMRRVLAEIDPAVEQWLVSQQQVTAVLGRRPRAVG